MQPGWYAHVQNPAAVAYFDGTAWGSVRDGFALSPDVQKTITPLQPGHPGPAAPFETMAVAASPVRKPGSGWFWGIGAGAALIVAGLLRGLSAAGANCGAPFKPDSVAAYMDAIAPEYGLGVTNYAAQCRDSIAGATALTWTLIVLGIIVLLASFLIQAVIRSGQINRAPVVVPTAASQIEELARLRDKGLVSPEEFEWKRQELLRRA